MALLIEVSPNLYIGDYFSVKKRENLLKNGITVVLNAAQELPDLVGLPVEYLRIDLTNSSETLDQISEAVAFIKAGVESGKVCVYCSSGLNRAPVFAAAYIMESEKLSTIQAVSRIRAIASIVDIHPGLYRKLLEFESRIFGNFAERRNKQNN